MNKKEFAKIIKNWAFHNKYNWKGINYPSGKNGWKTFVKNNPAIALNVLYVYKMNIYPATFQNAI